MIWVIGDIHGMLDPLVRLIYKIGWLHDHTDEHLEKMIFLGDYIDHGPSSRQVIDYILDLPFEKVFIMGNHDDLLLQFINQSDLFTKYGNVWFRGNGGQRTVHSFCPHIHLDENEEDFDASAFKLDDKYLNFFNNLKISHEETIGNQKFVFMHGLLSNQFSVSEQMAIKTYDDFHLWRQENHVWIEETMIWNRTEPQKRFDDFILVHGHIPTPKIGNIWPDFHDYRESDSDPLFKFEIIDDWQARIDASKITEYRMDTRQEQLISINVDTGAVYGHSLCALGISEKNLSENHMIVYKVNVSNGYRMRGDFSFSKVYFSR